MQERLVQSEKFVRIVSAPTGTGKSYAFMQAVIKDNAKVLFVVPTKRLLQNLICSAREQAREYLKSKQFEEAYITEWIEKRIVEWSGNQDKSDNENVVETRVRQLLFPKLENGFVIFAIPEILVYLVSEKVRISGASIVHNPFFYLEIFDHVVVDEFHTVDDRSFGLASLLSFCAIMQRMGKISLLSATPIDITGILGQLGIDSSEIEFIYEHVVNGHKSGHRPIHGNIELFIRNCSVVESCSMCIGEVNKTIANGQSVILIYDSLERLIKEENRLKDILSVEGIDKEDILWISSIDDSEKKNYESNRRNKFKDPRNYKILVCTSSVEIGVTFDSGLMFMEPGHNVASFIQRIGRVSRGKENGKVFISIEENTSFHNCSWIRKVSRIIQENHTLDINTFIGKILHDQKRTLELTPKEMQTGIDLTDSNITYFSKPSWRGAFWAALFIVAVQRKMMIAKSAQARLKDESPPIVRFVNAKINDILNVEVVDTDCRKSSQPHKRWVNALLKSALTFRDIGSTILVIDPDGTKRPVLEAFLRRTTNVLDTQVVEEENGETVVKLKKRTIREEVNHNSQKASGAQYLTLDVICPLGKRRYSLHIRASERNREVVYKRIVEKWKENYSSLISLKQNSCKSSQEVVIGAATALVQVLGKPPLIEDYEDDTEIDTRIS